MTIDGFVHPRRSGAAALAAFALVCAAAVAPADPAGRHPSDPFEPMVTREESALLASVMAVAETNTAAAVGLLRDARKPDDSAALDFILGNLHYRDRDLDAARAAYEAALEKFPPFRGAIVNLGRVHLLEDRPAEAIDLYRRLVRDGIADADSVLLLGHALMMEDRPVPAEAAYRQTLLLDPRHMEARLGLTKALMRQERYPEGLALVAEILRDDPVNRELWSLRANALLNAGDYEEAARAIETAHRLGCADADMLAALGDLLLNRNQPADGLKAYESAFSTAPPSAVLVLRAAEGFLMIGDMPGADRMLRRAADMKDAGETSFDAAAGLTLLRLRAERAQQAGDTDGALALCEEIVRIDPLDGRTLLLIAGLHQARGRLEDAAMTCERAARVKGFEADALVLHAQIEVARDRYAGAVALLESAQSFRAQPHVARYLDQLRRMLPQ